MIPRFVRRRKDAAPGVETDLRRRECQRGEEDESRGERRVSAEVHFSFGREPAQIEVVSFCEDERRLRKIVFLGNALQEFIRQRSSPECTPPPDFR